MTAPSINRKRVTVEAEAKAAAPHVSASEVPGRKAKAGVLRALKKISEDSSADLLNGKAAHAAYGHKLWHSSTTRAAPPTPVVENTIQNHCADSCNLKPTG
jgi:hypothetical protein